MTKTTGAFLFLGLTLVAAAFSDGTSIPTSPTSGEQGRIAFASQRDGNVEIYVVFADGSGLTRLTTTRPMTPSQPGHPTGRGSCSRATAMATLRFT